MSLSILGEEMRTSTAFELKLPVNLSKEGTDFLVNKFGNLSQYSF
jgi:hypothetical protein